LLNDATVLNPEKCGYFPREARRICFFPKTKGWLKNG